MSFIASNLEPYFWWYTLFIWVEKMFEIPKMYTFFFLLRLRGLILKILAKYLCKI